MTYLNTPSRRAVTTWLATSVLFGAAALTPAHSREISPIDRVPPHFSLRRFTSLSREEVYRVSHASRLGKRITIGQFSPSESRKILRRAAADWPATRQSLLR